jgi:dUTP pyrophosphatase
MKLMLDKNAVIPTRAHPYDGGMDLYAPEDIVIPESRYSEFFGEFQIGCVTIDTGVHLQIPVGCVGLLRSRSGLMVNHCITTDGTIDCGYTGSIRVKLFNHGRSHYEVKAGDKIAQLVIVPCLLPTRELVDSLDETDRGAGGFGSTGR